MIATAKRPVRRPRNWQQKFLEMLPAIQRQARWALRKLTPEEREEATADVVAHTFCAYCRLLDTGKESIAYPTPMARFAIAQFRMGCRVGTLRNVRDVSSPYAKAVKRIVLERLDQFDSREGRWREALIESRKAGPAETAAARIDVGDWFRRLARRKRKIAQALARGESTTKVAQMFDLTAARISQLRQELLANWQAFQGEPVTV